MPKNDHEKDDDNKGGNKKANDDQGKDKKAGKPGQANSQALSFPDVVETRLHVFSKDSYWKRPAGGPLVTPTYDITKTSGMKELYLGDDWMKYMESTNLPVAYDRIIAPDWGPSKGINDKGKLRFNTLVYPGRNVVNILREMKGLDGGQWGLVQSLPDDEIPGPEINANDTPHLIHTVYGSGNHNTWFPLEQFSPFVPIIGSGGRWIEMKWLDPIDLPRQVTVTDPAGVQLCATPGDLTTAAEPLPAGQQTVIGELRIATGGIWGRSETGWLPLRYNDKNPTDWVI